MSPAPKHTRRRWYQFGIGTMLLVVTVFAVWLGWELKFIRKRQAMIRQLRAGGSTAESTEELRRSPDGTYRPKAAAATIPFWRRWLGDEPVALIWLTTESEGRFIAMVGAMFPEADTQVVDRTIGRNVPHISNMRTMGSDGRWHSVLSHPPGTNNE